MWLVYTFLTVIFFGVGQIFVKKGLKNISPLFNNVLSTLLGFMLMVPYSLVNGVHFDKIPSLFPVIIIVPILFIFYFYIIGHGQLSLTGTVVGTYPLVTVLLSLIFLNEDPSIFQKVAICGIILGTVAIAWPNKVGNVKLGAWFLWAILAVFMIGTGDFLIKVLINQTDLYTYLFTYSLCSLGITALLYVADKKGRKLPQFHHKHYVPSLIGVGMIEIGFFIFHIAASQGFISLVSPISSLYVGVTAILAWIFLKEKISRIQAIGIAISVIGVILVGIA